MGIEAPELSKLVGGFDSSSGQNGSLEGVDASKVRGLGMLGALQARDDLRYTAKRHFDTMSGFAAVSPTYKDIGEEIRKFFVDPVVEVLPDVLRSSKLTLWTFKTLALMDEMYNASVEQFGGGLVADHSHIPPHPEFHIFEKAPLFKGGPYTRQYWGVDYDVAYYGKIALPLYIVGRDDIPDDRIYPKNCISTGKQELLSRLIKRADGSSISEEEILNTNSKPNYFQMVFEGSRLALPAGGSSDRSGIIIDLLMPLEDQGNEIRDSVIDDKGIEIVRCPVLSIHPYGPGDVMSMRSPILHYIYMRHFLRSKAATLDPPKRKIRKAISKWAKKKNVAIHENGIAITCLRDVDLARRDGESRRAHFKRLVEFSHRWEVSAHYRNQYYPSTGEHKRILISPYVKGPKGKPLIKKVRVDKVTR